MVQGVVSSGSTGDLSTFERAMFLGDDLLPYLLLALGAALVLGNALALVRPPREAKEGELTRAPVGRSIVMITIGLLTAVWALASLVTG